MGLVGLGKSIFVSIIFCLFEVEDGYVDVDVDGGWLVDFNCLFFLVLCESIVMVF